MRKRKRDHLDAEAVEALQQYLPLEYIGPGTKRFADGMRVLLELLETRSDFSHELGHDALHHGIWLGSGLSCGAVRDFVTNALQALGPGTERSDASNADLFEWAKQRLPSLPPVVCHELAHDHFAATPCVTVNAHIRCAWQTLLGAQLLEGALK